MVSDLVAGLLVAWALGAPQEPASPAPVSAAPAADEDRYVEIVTVPVPDDVVLEVGGLCELDDALFVCTRRGEVWRAEDPYGASPRWSLWAEGLQEPLGLVARDGGLLCAQRGELSLLRDRDGDGRMDALDTLAQGWPLSGNYHEYCFGPAVQPDGTIWLTLNKPFGEEPFGRAAFRGWAISIPPDGGAWVGECAGLRSPCGVATAPWGDVFYTDNQGEWCPTGKLALLRRGDFHGHPWGVESCALPESRVAPVGAVESGQRIDVAARAIPGFRLPAVWIPYDELGRSPAGFAWDSAGAFGPYAGQLFCGDQYSAEVFRVTLERVGDDWQGACYPFRRGLACGAVRVVQARDGALWCGLTNRGWGSLGQQEHGLQRIVWRGEVPFDLVEVTAAPAGFALRFSAPVAAAAAVAVRSWTYDLHEAYGCDPRDVRGHGAQVRVDPTRADRLLLDVDDLQPVRVYAIDAAAVRDRDGRAPWHGRAWYTRNQAP
ncbi:MAG: hypothetical protein AB7O97_08225 [Planctomycetota bacterium]